MGFRVNGRARVIDILLIAVLAAGGPIPAFATETHQFDVPAEDAPSAIRDFASQAHVQILVAGENVKEKHLRAVSGEFSTDQGLRLLLADSGLTPQYTGDRSIALVSAANLNSPLHSSAGSANGAKDEKKNLDRLRLTQVDQTNSGPQAVGDDQNSEKKKKEEGLTEIVVTGTHIRGDSNPTAPVQVITRENIERSGYTTTQQLVASIPQNFSGGAAGATEDGILGSGNLAYSNDSYATGINLRGLGESSTLVLVNGHRLASSADGIFVDISTIPLAAIDRVEILTDGASAIYGSDAVAGVANFILRKDYDGQETRLTYASGTDGTRKQEIVGQTVGRDWSGGSGLGTFQYQNIGSLSAADRSYTDASVQPTDLLPRSRQFSALVSAKQDLGAGFDVASDVLYSHSDRSGSQSMLASTTSFSPVTDNGVANITFGYKPSEQWHLEASGSYSREHTILTRQDDPPQFGGACGTGPCHTHDNFRIWSADVIADGTLFHAPGGDVKAALGGSYRNESLNWLFVELPPAYPFSRRVTAEFAEIQVPLVGSANAWRFVDRIDLSLAVRHDDYSDFGSTTNPRYGLSWKLAGGIHVRVAYSISFRAPNATEETFSTASIAQLVELPYPGPSGGSVPVFFRSGGGGPPLEPEKSRNVSFGVDWQPTSLPGFMTSINYFNIRYRNRILTPTFSATALSTPNIYGSLITPIPDDAAAQNYITEVLSKGGAFYDCVDAGCGPATTGGAGVRYLFNAFEQNAALVRTNGIDLSMSHHFSVGDNAFRAGVDATYIAAINTSYTNNSTPTDIVNTYANPLRWRARGQLGWSRAAWSVNTAINYSGAYVDTSSTPSAPIASWTTLDAQLGYKVPAVKGLTISLSGTNLFDKDPPYVAGVGEFNNVIHYDVGNASPLGRRIALEARMAW